MPNWKSYLKEDTLNWLLEDNNPSVRYFALTDLMDKKIDSPEVKETKSKIMTEGTVPKILNKQKSSGYWEESNSAYKPKYKATVWTFIILAELAADGNDDRIKQTCEYILEHAQHQSSGAFFWRSGSLNVIPCLTGNMVFSLIRCGYLKDSRIQKGIDWIVNYQRFDDRDTKPPKEWPYTAGPRKGDSCWGKHTCHHGVVNNLKALSEIPEDLRSNEVRHTIELASEYMLKHHIYKRSQDTNQIAKQKWLNVSFPPLGFDFLEVLFILSKLGYKDERMQDAIDLLLSKQNENGRWLLDVSLNGKVQANIEPKGKESKWITLNALRSLKYLYD